MSLFQLVLTFQDLFFLPLTLSWHLSSYLCTWAALAGSYQVRRLTPGELIVAVWGSCDANEEEMTFVYLSHRLQSSPVGFRWCSAAVIEAPVDLVHTWGGSRSCHELTSAAFSLFICHVSSAFGLFFFLVRVCFLWQTVTCVAPSTAPECTRPSSTGFPP